MKLDHQQQKVANHKMGHALVLAGAGSGKTATVVERASQLIAHGMNPSGLVMMTFTNKAAREMRQRIHARLDELDIRLETPPAVTTFHSFGQRIIMKNVESCERAGQPSLLEEGDQESLFMASLKKFNNDYEAKTAFKFYDKIRNEGLAAGFKDDDKLIEKMLINLINDLDKPVRWESFMMGYLDYEHAKKDNNVLDYHDLLILPIHALKKDPVLLNKFRKHIIDLTIDESQDTNIAQYELIKLLAPPNSTNQTVIMIGDEDQSIHRWRGANPDNLKLFHNDYAPETFRLEHNYRSMPEIVQRADHIIAHNSNRFDKKGIPTRSAKPDPIRYLQVNNADKMAENIARSIKESLNKGVSPSDIAILYRTNRMSNLLEPALLALDIPYKIYNGQDLLGRIESKTILAAIRFAINPHDKLAFNRLTELMPGVGAKLIATIQDTAPGETVFDTVLRLSEPQQALVVPMLVSIIDLRNAGPKKIMNWVDKQPEMRNWITKRAHAALKADKITKPKEFDIWKKFKKGTPITPAEKELLSGKDVITRCEKYQSRLNEKITIIIDRMKLVCKSINDRCAQLPSDASLADQWFEANNLVAAPPDEENRLPSVHLMTIHAAKGLEFKEVHIPSVSQGILPFNIETNDPDHIEDERRLMYVGFTRARDNLHLYHAEKINLMDGKGYRFVEPSQFISEAELNLSHNNDCMDRLSM